MLWLQEFDAREGDTFHTEENAVDPGRGELLA
jgi:hypothetical protein